MFRDSGGRKSRWRGAGNHERDFAPPPGEEAALALVRLKAYSPGTGIIRCS